MQTLTKGLLATLALAGSIASTPAHAALTPLTGIVQIAVGSDTACGVTSSGGAKCWGSQVGDGTKTYRAQAVDVPGLSSDVVAMAANSSANAIFGQLGGRVCALLSGGTVKCWGQNSSGQLGNGSTSESLVPADVVGLGGPAVALAAGAAHTCALISGGTVKCWGANGSGQLGDGTLTSSTSPVSVTGLTGVTAITAGYLHTCAVVTGGGVKCWGENGNGALGNGTTTDSASPLDVVSLTSGVASIVAAGGVNSGNFSAGHTCALTDLGGMKCWGSDGSGEQGGGPHTGHNLVPFDVLGLTSGVVGISAGGITGCQINCPIIYHQAAHSCALTAAGGVKCWGARAVLQHNSTPTDVAGLPGPVQAIASGGARTCALGTDGRVSCWGIWPTTAANATPELVQVGTAPQTISVGNLHLALGVTVLVPATATSGLPISATSLTPAICSASGPNVTGIAQGKCTLALDQAGDLHWEPAPQVIFSFPVGDPLAQSIAFGPTPTIFVGGTGPITATATSGLAVSLMSTTPSVCTISAGMVSGPAVGICTIVASQPGDQYYAAAPVVALTFTVAPNDGSSFPATVSKVGAGSGTVTSAPGGLSCGSTCGATFASGTSVTLTATPAAGSYFVGWTGACGGLTGNCILSMTAARSVTANFSIASSIPRLVNISTRTQVLTGSDVMIGGFIIGGSAPKTVVVRARGPSLTDGGVPGALANPLLQLFTGSTQIAVNDNWAEAANAAQVTASGFAPSHAAEAAILMQLNPGAYTAIVSGVGSTTGVAIVEVFEVDAFDVPLINIATRGRVQTGDNVMIAGLIIQGTGPQAVVVRARGPSLTQAGVPGVLADPQLQLFSGTTQLAVNDDWGTAANAADIQARCLAPPDAKESAILMTLQPGAYTAIVTGVAGTTGVAIVEVFRAPEPPVVCAF